MPFTSYDLSLIALALHGTDLQDSLSRLFDAQADETLMGLSLVLLRTELSYRGDDLVPRRTKRAIIAQLRENSMDREDPFSNLFQLDQTLENSETLRIEDPEEDAFSLEYVREQRREREVARRELARREQTPNVQPAGSPANWATLLAEQISDPEFSVTMPRVLETLAEMSQSALLVQPLPVPTKTVQAKAKKKSKKESSKPKSVWDRLGE